METQNGKHVVTTQYVRAAHGKAERDWPFIACSNSPFTEVCIAKPLVIVT
jgi:RNA polymerase-associated protein RTF1